MSGYAERMAVDVRVEHFFGLVRQICGEWVSGWE